MYSVRGLQLMHFIALNGIKVTRLRGTNSFIDADAPSQFGKYKFIDKSQLNRAKFMILLYFLLEDVVDTKIKHKNQECAVTTAREKGLLMNFWDAEINEMLL